MTTTNTPNPAGLDLVIERLRALAAELEQQAAANTAPMPVVLPDAPAEPELDQTALANALIQDVALEATRLLQEEIDGWLRNHPLVQLEWDGPGVQEGIYSDLVSLLAELIGPHTFIRATPKAEGSHRFRVY